MSKIKVAIFDSHNGSGFPKHIQDQITEKTFPENRCGSIIEILEKIPAEPDVDTLRAKFDKIKSGEILRWEDKFYIGRKDKYSMNVISCALVEVDTSRKWMIDNYDGAEFIKYLEFDCVSEKLNYWEPKR